MSAAIFWCVAVVIIAGASVVCAWSLWRIQKRLTGRKVLVRSTRPANPNWPAEERRRQKLSALKSKKPKSAKEQEKP